MDLNGRNQLQIWGEQYHPLAPVERAFAARDLGPGQEQGLKQVRERLGPTTEVPWEVGKPTGSPGLAHWVPSTFWDKEEGGKPKLRSWSKDMGGSDTVWDRMRWVWEPLGWPRP